MSIVLINNEDAVEGKVTFSRSIVNTGNETAIVFQGSFASEKYFEEIETIETEFLYIDKVHVLEEVFGSEEPTILYNFTAKFFEYKEETNGGSTDDEQ